MKTQDLSSMLEVRLWNRAPFQLGVGVLLIAWATLALGFLFFSSRQEQLFAEQHVRAAKKLSAVIASNVAQAMLAGGDSAVWNAISAKAVQYRDITGDANIVVFTAGGTVKAASNSAEVSDRFEVKDNPDCPRCDSTRPEDFPAVAKVRSGGGNWLRVVNAIPVSPDCMRCHEKTETARSFVSIDYDLAPLEREAAQQRDNFLLMGLVAGVLVMALTALLFRLLIMRSVQAIARSANRLAEGNLAARADVVGKNELALLARDFNHMAARIEQQVGRIEAAHTVSELLYTLVVEASKNLETGEVAAGVARVLLQKLRPRHTAFFLETTDGDWTCAAGGTSGDERVTSGEGTLEATLRGDARLLRLQLADMPMQMVAEACRKLKLQLTRDASGLTFALPIVAETHLVGLLIAIGIPVNFQVGEDQLDNLGMHLTLAAINSRNYTGAITDGLTRLKNKRYGLARLEEAVYAAKRYQSGLGLMICDIDHFKRVNDTYGHPAGDTVLKEISRRIAACVRKADIVVRYGGEEFMLILPETNAQPLAAIGEKVRRAVSATPVDLSAIGVSLPLTISVGVAAFHADSDSGAILIARADAALYRAKEGGRDRVESDR